MGINSRCPFFTVRLRQQSIVSQIRPTTAQLYGKQSYDLHKIPSHTQYSHPAKSVGLREYSQTEYSLAE